MMQSVDYNQISFLCLAAGFLTLWAFKTFAAFLNALKTKNKKLIRDPKQIEVWLNSYCSFNSSVTYVGLVDETYYYGARLLLNAVSVGLGYLFSLLFLQPFLYSIDVKSPYEYLQKRYGDRIICRIICAINGVIFHVSYIEYTYLVVVIGMWFNCSTSQIISRQWYIRERYLQLPLKPRNIEIINIF